MPLLEEAAVAGNPLAASILAELLTNDLATQAELNRALVFARRSAEAGFVPGRYVLGRMLRNGTGTKVDLPQAWKWLELAAAGGLVLAQELIGHIVSRRRRASQG